MENRSPEADVFTVFSALAEGSIVDIMKQMSPGVALVFLSAMESDDLWETFLPSDYMDIIRRSSESESDSRDFSSKKELFFSLCDSPLLIDDGRKTVWLEKKSGKKCYMLPSKELDITWSDDPEYWTWTCIPESRFLEVAILNYVCWFNVNGKIDTAMLSPRTKYAAYLVFNRKDSFGFKNVDVKSYFGIVEDEVTEKTIYLDKDTGEEEEDNVVEDEADDGFVSIEKVRSWINDTLNELYSSQESGKELLGLEDVATWMNNNLCLLNSSQEPKKEPEKEPEKFAESDDRYPKMREDNWLEIELGEFFNGGGESMELQISIKQHDDHWKKGLIIEGIEIRPKEDP